MLARQAAEALAALRAGISAHNAKVNGYDQEAAALETKPGNRGPRAEDSHVGRAGNGIRHGNKLVLKIGGNEAAYAVQHVVGGDLDAALGELVTTKDCSPPEPVAYWRNVVGQFGVMPQYAGNADRTLNVMIRDKRVVRMSAEEVTAWQASRR